MKTKEIWIKVIQGHFYTTPQLFSCLWTRNLTQSAGQRRYCIPEVKSGARFSQLVPNVPVWQIHLHSVPERTGLALLGQGAHLQASNSSRYCSSALLRCLLFVTAQGIPRTRSMMGSSWTNTNMQKCKMSSCDWRQRQNLSDGWRKKTSVNLVINHSRVVKYRLDPVNVCCSIWIRALPLPGESSCLSGSTSFYHGERLLCCLNVWA